MTRLLFVFCLVITVAAGPARADSGIPYVGQIEFAAPGGATILLVPDGSGPPLSQARDEIGDLVDATIRVQLVDHAWLPIWGFPGEDLWLQFDVDPGTAGACFTHPNFPGGIFMADAATDQNGWTTFTLPLRGGGWSQGPCWVYLNGMPAYDPDFVELPPVPLRANSPDINGDAVANLADVTYFAADFFYEGHFRSDLHPDGEINLSDLSILTQHLGAVCQ